MGYATSMRSGVSPLFSQNSTYCSWTIKLDPKDPKHLFEGNALIRCLVRIGVLDESRMRLDYVPDSMETEDFLELQLQTQVFKSDLVQSIHHSHVLIRKRHICVGKQIVNVPSFVVQLDSQKHIDFALIILVNVPSFVVWLDSQKHIDFALIILLLIIFSQKLDILLVNY